MQETPVPRYYLYGDALHDVEMDFLHIETIRERSGKHDWTIRAHAHPDHVQILYVAHGGGTICIEEREFEIPPESIIVVPRTLVHEIDFTPETDGTAVTAASAYATSVAQGDNRFLDVLAVPRVYPISGTGVDVEAVRDTFAWAHREYVWSAPGRRTAIRAQFLRILVALLRLRSQQPDAQVSAGGRDYEILCRYREILEQSYRSQKGIEHYAAMLGISTQRLNQACKLRGGKTSSEFLHERIVIEAKRYLIYMEMSVAEVGYELGFDDPAYFSRFFSQRTGLAPGAYRKKHRARRGQTAQGNQRAE